MADFDKKIKGAGTHQGHPAVNEITFPIFRPSMPASLENKVFITKKSVGDRKNIGRNQQKEVMDAISPQRIEKCVNTKKPEGRP